jgi:hypothetical protein
MTHTTVFRGSAHPAAPVVLRRRQAAEWATSPLAAGVRCIRRYRGPVPEWLTEFAFPSPWRDLRGQAADDRALALALIAELRREVAAGHMLHERTCQVVPMAYPADDVVVVVDAELVAIVHLTHAKADRPPWPMTEIFESAGSLLDGMEDRHPCEDYD